MTNSSMRRRVDPNNHTTGTTSSNATVLVLDEESTTATGSATTGAGATSSAQQHYSASLRSLSHFYTTIKAKVKGMILSKEKRTKSLGVLLGRRMLLLLWLLFFFLIPKLSSWIQQLWDHWALLQEMNQQTTSAGRRIASWTFVASHLKVMATAPSFNNLNNNNNIWWQWWWQLLSNDAAATGTSIQCRLPLLMFVTGAGNQGKSTVTRSLVDEKVVSSIFFPMERISTDVYAMEFCRLHNRTCDNTQLDKIYRELEYNPLEAKAFANYLGRNYDYLKQRDHNNNNIDSNNNNHKNNNIPPPPIPPTAIVFEGVGLTPNMIRTIRQNLGTNLDAITLEVSQGTILHQGSTVVNNVAMRSPLALYKQSLTQSSGSSSNVRQKQQDVYDWAPALTAHNIIVYLQHLYAHYLRNQLSAVSTASASCYSEIQYCSSNPKPIDQYKLLHLSQDVLMNKTILDADCHLNTAHHANHMTAHPSKPYRVVCLEPNNNHIKNVPSQQQQQQYGHCLGKIIMEATTNIEYVSSTTLEDFIHNNDSIRNHYVFDIISCVHCYDTYMFASTTSESVEKTTHFLQGIQRLIVSSSPPKQRQQEERHSGEGGGGERGGASTLVLQIPMTFLSHLEKIITDLNLFEKAFQGPGISSSEIVVHLKTTKKKTTLPSL